MLSADEIREAAGSLRRLLAAVEAGQLEAAPVVVERLWGAVEALDELTRSIPVRDTDV